MLNIELINQFNHGVCFWKLNRMCTKQTRYLYNIYLFIFKLRHVASIARLTGRAQDPPHFAQAPPHFAQAPPHFAHVFKKMSR